MTNMTAVEWLVQQIDNGKIEIIYSDKIHSIKCLPEFVKQALEMEKEQIMQAYKFNATGEPDGAEHYYEMFYKKY
jgi:hypothetical protein